MEGAHYPVVAILLLQAADNVLSPVRAAVVHDHDLKIFATATTQCMRREQCNPAFDTYARACSDGVLSNQKCGAGCQSLATSRRASSCASAGVLWALRGCYGNGSGWRGLATARSCV